ncbi:hypothetical protein lbkm_0674 [Lachnospiraceae bacterium KM106-2]|nr:hypothetical protein lbkm_0674 [Lachnospiraceae bacterium KM106-2]
MMANTEKVDDVSQITVSAKVLSKMIGVTERRIRQLAEEGILVKASQGRYKLNDSIHGYILTLKIANESKSFSNDLDDELDLDKEKALHERVKRHMAELKYALMKGDVHKSEDVEDVMNNMLSNFKSRCLSLPSKLTPLLLDRSDKAYVLKLLTDNIMQLLNELSEYNANDFFGDEYIDCDEDEEDEVIFNIEEN